MRARIKLGWWMLMLQKLTKEWTEPAEDGRSIRNKWTSLSLGVIEKVSAGTKAVFFQYGLVIAIVGFLLGRAMILSELTPFVLPFLAAVYMLKRERAPIAALSLVAGALTGYHGQIGFVIAAIIVYVLLQKVVAKYAKDMTKALPYTVFAASLMTRLGMVFT